MSNERPRKTRPALLPDWWRERLRVALDKHGARRATIKLVSERFGEDIRETDLTKYLKDQLQLSHETARHLSLVLGIAPPVYVAEDEAEAEVLYARQTLLRGSERQQANRGHAATITPDRGAADRRVDYLQVVTDERLAREVVPQLKRLHAEVSDPDTVGQDVGVQHAHGGTLGHERGLSQGVEGTEEDKPEVLR